MYINYFPEIYEDELLYSVFARFYIHYGSISQAATTEMIFGSRRRITSLDLPGHIAAFYSRIFGTDFGNFSGFVNGTTLLPYYTAFSTMEMRSRIMTAVRNGASDLHLRLGLSGFAVNRPTALRFCPACLEDMRAKVGETYWRRVHQLPGVLVCPDHGISLRLSSIELPLRKRLEYQPADERSCPPDVPDLLDACDPARLRLLFDIAVSSAGVLRSPPSARTSDEMAFDYRARADRAGLANAGCNLRHEELTNAFVSLYKDVLPVLGVQLPNKTGLGWLAAMLKKHRCAFHPLQHILVDHFLSTAIGSAQGAPVALPSAFGSGPWPCRNPLCEHFGTAFIKTARSHRHKDCTIGIFECDCGYSYTRGVDSFGTLRQPRYRAFGPTLEEPLRTWIASGRSMWSIGQQLGLCAKTIAREASALRIGTVTTSGHQVQPVSLLADPRSDRDC